jgi:F-type H+-transporting ATPase subunit epsilon
MAMTIHVDVVSAETLLFSGAATSIVIPGERGELEVYPRHAPLVTKLKPGSVRVKRPDGQEEELIFVNGGLVEVQPDVVTIMSDTGIRGKDLDEAKAQEAKRAAEEAMKNKTGAMEIAQAQAELAEAVAQLAAIQKLRKIK